MGQALRDIMTQDLRTCPASSVLTDAARAMRDADVGDVIVLEDDGTMCGIVTDRDITIRAVAAGRDPSQVKLTDVCSKDVMTLGPDDDADEAVKMMRERAIRRVPITEDGKPVGIVSIGDLAMAMDPASALADISAQPANN